MTSRRSEPSQMGPLLDLADRATCRGRVSRGAQAIMAVAACLMLFACSGEREAASTGDGEDTGARSEVGALQAQRPLQRRLGASGATACRSSSPPAGTGGSCSARPDHEASSSKSPTSSSAQPRLRAAARTPTRRRGPDQGDGRRSSRIDLRPLVQPRSQKARGQLAGDPWNRPMRTMRRATNVSPA
jgi:hypothetical protein